MRKLTLALFVAGLAAAAACLFVSVACAVDTASEPEMGQASFAPAAAGETTAGKPVTVMDENYRIVEEDILRMDVWNEAQLSNMQMQVTPDGKINVPYIGAIPAAGRTQKEITDHIVQALEDREIIANAKVQITLLSIHQPTARVLGEVNRAGAIVFKDGDNVLDAIAQAGSYTNNALLEKATLTHKNADRRIPIDLKRMLEEGDLSQNYTLQNGDTIYIPPEDYNNKFYVLGQVYRPGIFDLKDNTTVLTAISMASGATERGSLRNTVVIRGNPAKPERVACDLTRLFDKADRSQDIQLEPGDVVIVPETKKPNWPEISSILSTILNVTYIRRYGLF